MPFAEAVYESLVGELSGRFHVPGVENMFAEGSACLSQYEQMRQAYDRLLERLGVEDDDPDIEDIICRLTAIQKLLCLRMYEIGTLIGAGYRPPPF